MDSCKSFLSTIRLSDRKPTDACAFRCGCKIKSHLTRKEASFVNLTTRTPGSAIKIGSERRN